MGILIDSRMGGPAVEIAHRGLLIVEAGHNLVTGFYVTPSHRRVEGPY